MTHGSLLMSMSSYGLAGTETLPPCLKSKSIFFSLKMKTQNV